MLNKLLDIVLTSDEIEFENDAYNLHSFRLALNLIANSEIGYLYSTAVFHWKYTLSNYILNETGYNLNNQFIKKEIIWCAENERFDCIAKFLDDGYYPNLQDIIDIKTYFRENNIQLKASDLFQRLNHIHSIRRIENIVTKMHNNK